MIARMLVGIASPIMLVGLFLFTLPHTASSEKPITEGVWCLQHGDWYLVAPEEPNIRAADVALVRFCQNGTFTMIKCVITKEDKLVSISHYDGYSESEGTWRRKDQNLYVRFRETWADDDMVVPANGKREPLPGPWHEEVWTTCKDAITTANDKWVRIEGIRKEDIDESLACTGSTSQETSVP